MARLRSLAIASTLGAAVAAFTPSDLVIRGRSAFSVDGIISSRPPISPGLPKGKHRCGTSRAVSASSVPSTAANRVSRKSAGLPEIEDSNYRDILGGEKAVLIDACAPWCGPCKLIQPALMKSADKWSKSVQVVKYNIEGENTAVLRSELRKMGIKISSLPTLILLKDGQPISSRSGVVTDMDINIFLSSNLHRARVARQEEEEIASVRQ